MASAKPFSAALSRAHYSGSAHGANTSVIASVDARPLTVAMSAPFEIAGGSQTRVENVLIRVWLADGTVGFGECAPMRAVNHETQASVLKAARRTAARLEGRDASRLLPLSRWMEDRLGLHGCVRAGLEMAVLDAATRQRRIPLWTYFGGSSQRVRTDVTVPIMPPEAAADAARDIARRGVSTIKIKVGRDIEEDVARVRAVAQTAPKATLIVDANQGYCASEALRFLKILRRRNIRPVLFEQPVHRSDWDGLAEVSRKGKVPVAADETVSSREDAWEMIRRRSAEVINIKLMKCGIMEALDIARIARSAGLRLMMGGMVESYLAMGCAAHFAAGLGGFDFIDLDTPLWFARNPMRGLSLRHGGFYDLSPVRAGIGVTPNVP